MFFVVLFRSKIALVSTETIGGVEVGFITRENEVPPPYMTLSDLKPCQNSWGTYLQNGVHHGPTWPFLAWVR